MLLLLVLFLFQLLLKKLLSLFKLFLKAQNIIK